LPLGIEAMRLIRPTASGPCIIDVRSRFHRRLSIDLLDNILSHAEQYRGSVGAREFSLLQFLFRNLRRYLKRRDTTNVPLSGHKEASR
jgi:DNA-binding response OmpR family regulator